MIEKLLKVLIYKFMFILHKANYLEIKISKYLDLN